MLIGSISEYKQNGEFVDIDLRFGQLPNAKYMYPLAVRKFRPNCKEVNLSHFPLVKCFNPYDPISQVPKIIKNIYPSLAFPNVCKIS